MKSPDSGDGLSVPTATPEKSNEPTGTEAGATQKSASKSAVYPLFADSTSKSKTAAIAAFPAKPSAMSQGPSSSAEESTLKRKAN